MRIDRSRCSARPDRQILAVVRFGPWFGIFALFRLSARQRLMKGASARPSRSRLRMTLFSMNRSVAMDQHVLGLMPGTCRRSFVKKTHQNKASGDTSGISLAASTLISKFIIRRSLQRRIKPAELHSSAYFASTICRACDSNAATRFERPFATIGDLDPLPFPDADTVGVLLGVIGLVQGGTGFGQAPRISAETGNTQPVAIMRGQRPAVQSPSVTPAPTSIKSTEDAFPPDHKIGS
jgi:hypothetical protein